MIGKFIKNTGNTIVLLIIKRQYFPDWVLIPKILPGGFLVHHDGFGFSKNRFGISLQQRDGKDIKKRMVAKYNPLLFKKRFVVFDHKTSPVPKTDGIFNFREFMDEGIGGTGRQYGHMMMTPPVKDFRSHPIDPVGIFIVSVITDFMLDKHQYQQAAGHANGQAKYIDK